MTKQKRNYFKRKDANCTSFYFILCGELLEKVNERRNIHEKQTGSKLSYPAAVSLLILGK